MGFSNIFRRRRPAHPHDMVLGLDPMWRVIQKYGENPDLDQGGGYEHVHDGSGVYLPPTQARIHDVASDNIADVGDLLSSGNITLNSSSALIDSGATFISDGVTAGDAILNDTNITIGQVLSLTETSIVVTGIFDPATGLQRTKHSSGDAYRIVTNGSTGASVMYLDGLDGNYLRAEEFIILNGTTNVPTLIEYVRQHRGRIFGKGTSGATGIVTSTAQIDGTVSCRIIDGNNQTLMAIYTVPINETGFLTLWWGTLSKKVSAVCIFRLRIGTLGANEISYILQPRSVLSGGKSDFYYEYKKALVIPGGVDVWAEAETDTNNTGVSAGFDIDIKNVRH